MKLSLFTLVFVVTAAWTMAQSTGAVPYQQKDEAKSIRVLLKEAKKGNSDAQYDLGSRYAEGKGVKKSITDAIKWLNKAGDNQHAEALVLVGSIYEYTLNKGEVAKKKYRQAADLGHAEGMACLGNYYLNNGEVTEGVAWLEKAAEKGSTLAMYWLGTAYFCGQGVAVDYGKAMKYLSRTNVRNQEVTLRRAIMYYKGLGCEMDWEKARQLIAPLARNGNYPARLLQLIDRSKTEYGDGEGERSTYPVFTYLNDASWIAKNVRYPVEAMANHIQGKVELNCVVDKGGKISVESVKNSPHELLSEASALVVQKMPLWIPATRGDEKIEWKLVIPVNFVMSGSF